MSGGGEYTTSGGGYTIVCLEEVSIVCLGDGLALLPLTGNGVTEQLSKPQVIATDFAVH